VSYTKRQLVETAFEELGLASYTFDLQPDAIMSGLRRLNTMMGEWNGRGINLGYPQPFGPDDGDLDVESNVPATAAEAVITNLAIRIGPSFGKSALAETKATAKFAFNQLLTAAAIPQQRRMPQMVAGAGNKPWIYGQPFIPATRFCDAPDQMPDWS
jgi:hypothetical protein